MKAIVKVKPEEGGLELRDLPIPKPGPNDVLLKNRVVSVCGTDLHIYNWDQWSQKRCKLPLTIGHEFAADIVEVGKMVKEFKPGDFVSGEGHLFCGLCDNCRTGKAHVCYSWKGIGYDVDGVFCEYYVLPQQNVWKNHPDTSPKQAAIQDPLGNAIHTVFRVDCVGKTVAVFGAGAVGLLAVSILKAIGAREIFIIEKDNQYRLDIAKKLGADHCIKIVDTDPAEYIHQHTNGMGTDVVLEIAGAPKAIQAAVKTVKQGGDIVLIGVPNQDISIDIASDIVFRSVSMHGITGRRIWDSWFRMRGLLASGRLELDPIITHSFDFEDYESAFKLMQTGQCGKVVLTFD